MGLIPPEGTRMLTRMRVLQLTNMWPDERRPYWGAFVKAQVDSLSRLGVESIVRIVDGGQSKLRYFQAAVAIGRLARRDAADLIHAHYGLTGVVAALQTRVPIVVSLYGSDVNSAWQRPLSAMAARRASRTIVCSSHMAARLPSGVRASVLAPGIDTALLFPRDGQEARSRLGWRDEPLLLFGADPTRALKDFPLFNDVVSRLGTRRVDIATLGRVPFADLPYLYSAADCLLLTSKTEGSPTVVKEALACGCPVVSVDVGDVERLIAADRSCRLVRSRDPRVLAAAVEEVLNSGLRADAARAAERFSLERVALQVVSLYNEALGRRDTPAVAHP